MRTRGLASSPRESGPLVLESPKLGDHPGLRSGDAGWVWMSDEGELETNTRVELSPNSTHALLGHGVVDGLNRLDLEMGLAGEGRDILIPQSVLDDASDLFYEADRRTYGAIYEFPVEGRDGAETCVIRIDNREYQRCLARLQDLLRGASRAGHAVRLRI